MKPLAIAAITLALTSTSALAKSHHSHSYHRQYHRHSQVKHHNIYDRGTALAHPEGCPWHAFCGCGVSVKVFGHVVADLKLAWNWARKFPHAAPGPGKVAVWPHHVVYIESYQNGIALVYDPNSGGHQTRVHHRSLAGAVIVDPKGTKIAGT